MIESRNFVFKTENLAVNPGNLVFKSGNPAKATRNLVEESRNLAEETRNFAKAARNLAGMTGNAARAFHFHKIVVRRVKSFFTCEKLTSRLPETVLLKTFVNSRIRN